MAMQLCIKNDVLLKLINMKELSLEKMESCQGKGWADYVDVGCAVFGAALVLYTNPVSIACAGWSLGREMFS